MSSCYHDSNKDNSFVRLISRYIGKAITIFTTSGVASDSGFTGTVLSVNSQFVRLITQQATPPTNPVGDKMNDNIQIIRFIWDIPVEQIVAFYPNAA